MESRNVIEWNGLQWNGTKWNGKDWSGVDTNGMQLKEESTNFALQSRDFSFYIRNDLDSEIKFSNQGGGFVPPKMV